MRGKPHRSPSARGIISPLPCKWSRVAGRLEQRRHHLRAHRGGKNCQSGWRRSPTSLNRRSASRLNASPKTLEAVRRACGGVVEGGPEGGPTWLCRCRRQDRHLSGSLFRQRRQRKKPAQNPGSRLVRQFCPGGKRSDRRRRYYRARRPWGHRGSTGGPRADEGIFPTKEREGLCEDVEPWRLLFPAITADKFDKAAAAPVIVFQTLRCFVHDIQGLTAAVANRDNQPPTHG